MAILIENVVYFIQESKHTLRLIVMVYVGQIPVSPLSPTVTSSPASAVNSISQEHSWTTVMAANAHRPQIHQPSYYTHLPLISHSSWEYKRTPHSHSSGKATPHYFSIRSWILPSHYYCACSVTIVSDLCSVYLVSDVCIACDILFANSSILCLLTYSDLCPTS